MHTYIYTHAHAHTHAELTDEGTVAGGLEVELQRDVAAEVPAAVDLGRRAQHGRGERDIPKELA